MSSFFGAKFGKHIEELLVSPLPNWIIVPAIPAGGLIRGLLVALVVTAVSLFFTRLPIAHPGAIIVGGAADLDRVLARRASSTRSSRAISTR